MSDEVKRQGFVDAILHEPDVEDHRLVFADWLEDRGELEEARKYRELPGTAALWCADWGRDKYGLWCDLAIGGVVQCLRWIPPGTFRMGSSDLDKRGHDSEGSRDQVTISSGFWMFDAPCAQELFEVVMGSNPSHFREHHRPVECVSWQDCQQFLAHLNSRIRGLELRLPTEIEWEYACRAGTEGPRYNANIDQIAWYFDNSNGQTHPVKEKLPNGFGLFDMLGNVWEWCEDNLIPDTEMSETDSGEWYALRGGSWRNYSGTVRSGFTRRAFSQERTNGIGFRCVTSSGVKTA